MLIQHAHYPITIFHYPLAPYCWTADCGLWTIDTAPSPYIDGKKTSLVHFQLNMSEEDTISHSSSKRFTIANLHKTSTEEEIRSLFGLTSEDLRPVTSVEISHKKASGKNKTTAVVTVPEHLFEDLVKLDKIVFEGRELKLTTLLDDGYSGTSPAKTPPSSSARDVARNKTPPPPPTKQSESTEAGATTVATEPGAATVATEPGAATVATEPRVEMQVTTEGAETPQKTKQFFLQFSTVAKPFGLPTQTEVGLAAQQHFLQEGIKCIPIRKGAETAYKFQLREEVSAEGHSLKFKDFAVALEAWQNKPHTQRREGTLLTFRRAGDGELENVPGAAFDAAIEHLKLSLIVQTKFQRIKDTRVLNGNRFCVIDTPKNLKIVPESIPVTDPSTKVTFQVNVTFKGQERYCSSCNEMHVGQCPKIKARREAWSERGEQEIKTKMYGDSTLRSVDVLGLRSEVLSMPGGGLGQIVQAVIDDPDNEYDKIVIFGGTNDKKHENFPDIEHFAANIDSSLLKLANHARQEASKEKTFFLIQQYPVVEGQTVGQTDPEPVIRELYLARRMGEIATNVANVESFPITYDADHTGHPSPKGTEQIIKELHKLEISPNPLIWKKDYITTERAYSSVESIYRYGCNGCDRYGTSFPRDVHSNQLLCDVCFDGFPDEPNELIQDIAERVNARLEAARNQNFPPPAGEGEDSTVEMETH